ncbi:ABC transporter permease [Paraburkholderia sp. GAS348]|uniref:ABC transporter permease n=1 Tax=Paraburkholderia sp. GAS348 TaxID=3035132 RepID=UPI003D239767
MTSSKLPKNVTREGVDELHFNLGERFKPYNYQKVGILLASVLLVTIVTIGNADFLSAGNIANMLSQWAPAGIVAVGMTFVVIAGGFDLSVASTFSFAAVVAAFAGQALPPSVAMSCAILVGGVIGLANALLILGIGINPFIATVGSAFVVNGLSFVLTKNAAFIVQASDFSILGSGRFHGIPYSGMLLLGLIFVATLILKRTVYGHMLYAVGGNSEASRLSGIPIKWISSVTYVGLGLCCGLAGFLSASQLSSAQSSVDQNFLFDVMTIVIVGGTSLGGGAGSIFQTTIGLMIVATITNGFVLLDISPFYQDILKGIIILSALTFDSIFKRFRN